jgi:hypothetical protein
MTEDCGDPHGIFPFTEGELHEFDISIDETEEQRTKGSKCLIGRLGVVKKIHRDTFKAVLVRIRRTVGNVFFKEIQENLWLFEFFEDSDKRRALEGRPWSYDRTLLILNELDGQTSPFQMDFSLTPIWMQIQDMPLDCTSRGVGFKIGSSLGKAEDVVVAEDDVGWGKYLHVREDARFQRRKSTMRRQPGGPGSGLKNYHKAQDFQKFQGLPDQCHRKNPLRQRNQLRKVLKKHLIWKGIFQRVRHKST